MLSIIVYGRNDSHGYNLHRRAALSLNSMAELLQEHDDELIFVDYNTPKQLPSFIHAIHDTLTEHCLNKLRVLRVSEDIHARRYQAHTSLKALESIARNVAIRRSNKNNRWLLSTNTDMIFIEKNGAKTLHSCLKELPEGAYGLPRFELPEALWESFDRRAPQAIMNFLKFEASAYHLKEIARSKSYNLFDAPGDFQLMLREQAFAISGFDERMIWTAHQDSNLCRRLSLLNGEMHDLSAHLEGYHCAHTRVATYINQSEPKFNNLLSYTEAVETPYLSQNTWGLVDEDIEEVLLNNNHYACAITETLKFAQTEVYESNHSYDFSRVAYSAAHILPFIASTLAPLPKTQNIHYRGCNKSLATYLQQAMLSMSFDKPLVISFSEDAEFFASLLNSDTIIFDFSFDKATHSEDALCLSLSERIDLGGVITQFERSISYLRAQSKSRKSHPPLFIVIGASSNLFDGLVREHLDLIMTPYSTHIRHGYLKDASRLNLSKFSHYRHWLKVLLKKGQSYRRHRLYRDAFFYQRPNENEVSNIHNIGKRYIIGERPFRGFRFEGAWQYSRAFSLESTGQASLYLRPNQSPQAWLDIIIIARGIDDGAILKFNTYKYAIKLQAIGEFNIYHFRVDARHAPLGEWCIEFDQQDMFQIRQIRILSDRDVLLRAYLTLDKVIFEVEQRLYQFWLPLERAAKKFFSKA